MFCQNEEAPKAVDTVIKILQSSLAKLVPHQTHTKLLSIPVPVIPVSSKPVFYKQLIKTVKQYKYNNGHRHHQLQL